MEVEGGGRWRWRKRRDKGRAVTCPPALVDSKKIKYSLAGLLNCKSSQRPAVKRLLSFLVNSRLPLVPFEVAVEPEELGSTSLSPTPPRGQPLP